MISHDHTEGSLLTPSTFVLIVHIEDYAYTKFGFIFCLPNLVCFLVILSLVCMSELSWCHMHELYALFSIKGSLEC